MFKSTWVALICLKICILDIHRTHDTENKMRVAMNYARCMNNGLYKITKSVF